MAKQDYLPKEIDDIDTFFETWKNNIAALLASLGLALTHADAAKLKVSDTRTKFSAWKDIKAQAQSKADTFYASLKDTLETLRPYNQNLKTTTGYTPALGTTVGIEGPEETPFDETTAKPAGKAIYEGGQVTIKFNKPRQVASVEIKCRRGADTAFSFVADDTNSPYNDNRANLDVSKPENREYVLQYKNKAGALIGQPSDTVKITVA